MRDAQAHRKPDPLVVYTNHTPSPGGGGGGAIRMGVSNQSTKASKSRRVETEPQGSSALVLHMKNNAVAIDARSSQGKPPPGGGAGAIRQASGTMEMRVPRPIGRAGRIPKAGAGAPPPKVVAPMETLIVVPQAKVPRRSGSVPKKDEVKIAAGPTPKPIDTTPKRPRTDDLPVEIKKARPSTGPPLPKEHQIKPSRTPRKPRKSKANKVVKPSSAPPIEEEEIVSPPKPSGRPSKKVKPSATPPEKPVSPPNPTEPPPKKPRTKTTEPSAKKIRLRQKTGPTLPPPNRITAKMLKTGFGDTIVAMNFEKAALAEIRNIVAQMQGPITAAKTRSLTKRAKELYGEHYRSQRIKV